MKRQKGKALKHKEYYELLANETLKLFLDPSKLMQDQSALNTRHATGYVRAFIELVLGKIFNDRPLILSDVDQAKHIEKEYFQFRRDLEDKIGEAFTNAVNGNDMSKELLVYGCQIGYIEDERGKYEH